MNIGGATTRILGLVALITAAGCGSGSAQLPVTPPAASPARVSSTGPPDAASPGPSEKAKVVAPHPMPGFRRSFDAPIHAPAVATGDPELDPLVSYLKASFAEAIKDGGRLVIEDTTDLELLHFRRPYQDLVDGLLGQASDQVPAEMIRDFGEKNRQAGAIWPEITRYLPASLLSPGGRKAFFSGNSDEGWYDFYKKYHGSHGIITVSRVGLNRDKTMAFFYVAVGSGTLSGYGQLHVLKKAGDAWVESPVEIFPYWIA